MVLLSAVLDQLMQLSSDQSIQHETLHFTTGLVTSYQWDRRRIPDWRRCEKFPRVAAYLVGSATETICVDLVPALAVLAILTSLPSLGFFHRGSSEALADRLIPFEGGFQGNF